MTEGSALRNLRGSRRGRDQRLSSAEKPRARNDQRALQECLLHSFRTGCRRLGEACAPTERATVGYVVGVDAGHILIQLSLAFGAKL